MLLESSFESGKRNYRKIFMFLFVIDNPVSNILSNIFVVPVLRKLSGVEDPRHTILKAKVEFLFPLIIH